MNKTLLLNAPKQVRIGFKYKSLKKVFQDLSQIGPKMY